MPEHSEALPFEASFKAHVKFRLDSEKVQVANLRIQFDDQSLENADPLREDAGPLQL